MASAKTKQDKNKLAGDDHTVAVNRRARYDYDIQDSFEAGMVLTGTEVKSLRRSDAQIAESYAVLEMGRNGRREAWVHNLHIAPYKEGNLFNVESRRKRKLLLRRDQIERLSTSTLQKGYTLVPLKLYFARGKAKLQIGVARGKKQHDKRHAIEERQVKRDMQRIVHD